MTNSYTSINETSFCIQLEIENFTNDTRAHGDRITHSGFEWSVSGTCPKQGELSASLMCHGNDSNGWTAVVKCVTKVYKSDNSIMNSDFIYHYTSDSKYGGTTFTLIQPGGNPPLWSYGRMRIECVVEVQTITGNEPQRRHNFMQKTELSDFTLLIQGKELYVSKMTLACFSPVLHSMFYSDFKERDLSSIELKEDDYNDFERFLQILYHCNVEIKASNVGGFLKLADKYDTPSVTEKCETFLLSTARVKPMEKLCYAETYSLQRLLKKCINSINSVQKYEECCVELEKRDKKTLIELVRKALEIFKTPAPAPVPAAVYYANPRPFP